MDHKKTRKNAKCPRSWSLFCTVLILFGAAICYLMYSGELKFNSAVNKPILQKFRSTEDLEVERSLHYDPANEKNNLVDRSLANVNAADLINEIETKQQEMCMQFPNNEDCFMLESVVENPVQTSGTEHALTRKILSKLMSDDDKELNAVWTGTSNSAGHGNFYDQSYPFVIDRTLTDIFAEAGIAFNSINTAIGSIGAFPRPQYCQSATYGESADIMGFEFGMMRPSDCDKERWATTAIANQNNPVLVELNPGGPSHCAQRYTEIYYDDNVDNDEFLSHLKCKENSSLKWDSIDASYYLGDSYYEDCKITSDDLTYLDQFTKSEQERQESHHGATKCAADGGLCDKYGDWGYTSFDHHAATGEDSIAYWLARAELCRQGHHPGILGHYLMGQQISYWILDHFKKALNLYKSADQNTLNEIASQTFSLPNGIEECSLGGAHQTQCWMSLEPRFNTPLEKLIVTENFEWKEWFGPGASERDERGYADIHAQIEITDNQPLIIQFEIPQKMAKNHEDGRVWVAICGETEKFDDITMVQLDEKEIDLNSADENFDDIQDFKITSEKPHKKEFKNMCVALGVLNVGEHQLTIQGEGFAIRHLFLA